MDIFVYSDESGVFDVVHQDFYVFGGIILLGKEQRDKRTRMYSSVEKIVGRQTGINGEVKASKLTGFYKNKLYRSLGQVYKFGVVVELNELNRRIFENRKHKQRYLDYAYKISLKSAFNELIRRHVIDRNSISNIYVFPDEHRTATDGRYELEEGLYSEFKNGTFNPNYNTFFEPLFPTMRGFVKVQFCNSASVGLVRAADIVANYIFHLRLSKKEKTYLDSNLLLTYLP